MKRSEARAAARAQRPKEAAQVDARAWFIVGFVHLAAAAIAGAALAATSTFLPREAHVIVALTGVFLVAGGLAYGFAPPFLKREVIAPGLAMLPLAAILAGDAASLVSAALGRDALHPLLVGAGIAFLLLPLHLFGSAAVGRAWRGGVALFAKDQPFRRGDLLAASAFAVSLVGWAAAGATFLAPPRGIASTGIVLALFLGVMPFFAGVLAFLLPRNAKAPMPGLTLAAAALFFQTLSALGLAYAFARPLGADFRFPAAGILLATLLFAVALLRNRFPEKPGPQLVRARPFLNAALALAGLAAVTLPLAFLHGLPNDLVPVTLYLHLLLAASLATACALLGAPILLNAVPREGSWGKWAAATAILGMFLLAPAFQYPRPPFPGAALIAAASILLVWGLAPMRKPRREC